MNTNKLIEVLSIQTCSYEQELMSEYITRAVTKLGCSFYESDGSIYVTKGDAVRYPCIVSHMDTVHRITTNLTAVKIGGNITGFNAHTMAQTGIGGDDKVGVFIALQCLEKFDCIKAVFFRDEETGCEGSYNADVDFFHDCNIVLQCDRKGNADFVTNASGTELSSKHFQKDVKGILTKHGYKFASGLMTDVMALKEVGVVASMANISCGYYHPHTPSEYVNIADVTNCMNMVFSIIETLTNDYPCKYKYSKPVYKSYAGKWNSWKYPKSKSKDKGIWGPDGDDFWTAPEVDKPMEYCTCCDQIGHLQYIAEFNTELCEQCIKEYCTVK